MARTDRKTRNERSVSTEKHIVSIRMPAEILAFVEREARARGAALGLKGEDLDAAVNVTATVNRILEAVRTWFGLPAIVAEALERDRAELGLGQLEYLQYLAFRRYEALARNGPGFDKASVPTDRPAPPRR
jgi:hypothetical protein